MIKIGIDPSGTGTTAIVLFENNNLQIHHEYINKYWISHANEILSFIKKLYNKYDKFILIFENYLPINVGGSKDRDDLLRLLGAIEQKLNELQIKFNWVSPRHTKSVVKKIEQKSKFLKENPYLNDNFGDIKIGWEKDAKLCYEYGKGWKYNNEKISNHLRDAIIIANYES